jgi:hypothetical protein
LAQTPSVQWPLVHWTSKLHGAPSAAAFAGPHVPSSPETLRAPRQRSLGEQVRSQQVPSSQCPLVQSSPRVHDPVAGVPVSIAPASAEPASVPPPSPFSTPSE